MNKVQVDDALLLLALPCGQQLSKSRDADHPPGFHRFPERLPDDGRNLPVMGLHHGRDLGDTVDDRTIPRAFLTGFLTYTNGACSVRRFSVALSISPTQ